jgi:predicted nucleic acid-binding Zn ribbon protein
VAILWPTTSYSCGASAAASSVLDQFVHNAAVQLVLCVAEPVRAQLRGNRQLDPVSTNAGERTAR